MYGDVDDPKQRVVLIDNEDILRSEGSAPVRRLVDLVFGNRARIEGLLKLGGSDGFTPKMVEMLKRESFRKTLPRVSIILSLVILQIRHVIKLQRQHWRFVGMIERLDKIYAEKGFDAVRQSLEEVVGDKRPEVLERWKQLVTAGYKEGERTELRSLFSVARGQGYFKRFVVLPIIVRAVSSLINRVTKYKLAALISLLPFLVFIPSSLKVGSKDADEETVSAVKKSTDEIMNLWSNDWSVRAKFKRMWNWVASTFRSAPKREEAALEEVISDDDGVVA